MSLLDEQRGSATRDFGRSELRTRGSGLVSGAKQLWYRASPGWPLARGARQDGEKHDKSFVALESSGRRVRRNEGRGRAHVIAWTVAQP